MRKEKQAAAKQTFVFPEHRTSKSPKKSDKEREARFCESIARKGKTSGCEGYKAAAWGSI